MYGFSKVRHGDLNLQNIQSRVSDIILWRYYLGFDFSPGMRYSAPYRKDNNPSFNVYYNGRGDLVFKDFSTGQRGDIINFIELLKGCNFKEALEQINLDFNLKLGDPTTKSSISKTEQKNLIKFEKDFIYTPANTLKIDVVARKYNRKDIEYWTKYGISYDTLKMYNVYAIDRMRINNYQSYNYDPLNPGYAYHFPITNHVKCYFPMGAKGSRFPNNVNNYEDVQGYYQCDVKGERPNKLLILTKSMKDVMLLREFNIDAMAINGEGHYFHKDFIRHIKKYYPIVISLYDSDEAGIKAARLLWKEHRIAPYLIPRRYRGSKCKDITDVCAVFSKTEAEEVIKKMIEEVF